VVLKNERVSKVCGCIRLSYRPFRSQTWLKLIARGNITGLYSHLQPPTGWQGSAFTSLTTYMDCQCILEKQPGKAVITCSECEINSLFIYIPLMKNQNC